MTRPAGTLPVLIDSHCHLDDPRFDADREEALARARAAGVGALLLAGVDRDRWRRALPLLAGKPELALAAGVHPWVAADASPEGLAGELAWVAEAAADPRCVALGETGLDAARARAPGAIERQQQAFRRQLELSRATGLPLVLHVVRAHGRALALLRGAGPLPGGVVHSFAGSPEEARAYLALGLHLSFGTALTRPQPGRLATLAAACPAERLLVETDAPDRPVQQRHGSRGEPADLPLVVAALARARGEDPAQVGEATARAARKLFVRAWGNC